MLLRPPTSLIISLTLRKLSHSKLSNDHSFKDYRDVSTSNRPQSFYVRAHHMALGADS